MRSTRLIGASILQSNLEYDAGVGAKRNVLSERPDEKHLLILDSDMEVPHNFEVLRQQLEARPDVGGVSGMYLERGRISTVSTDLYTVGVDLHRGIRERPTIERVSESPFVEFDFHPQVGVFRTACFEDYTWDANYTIGGEHLDFYVGHKQTTDWVFGLCPEVLIPHDPGGSEEYVAHRYSELKNERSREYFLSKWGYDDIVQETDRWIDTYDPDTRSFHLHVSVYPAASTTGTT